MIQWSRHSRKGFRSFVFTTGIIPRLVAGVFIGSISLAAFGQQTFNPDPSQKWKEWQSAGNATVHTVQLRDGNVYKLSPAQIIYYSALENKVNPVLLIVKLQHEQGLLGNIYSGAELQRRLDRASGFGVYDSKPTSTDWPGFYPQLVAASYQFGDLWKRTYQSGKDAIARYSSDPKAGEKVATIYGNYAQLMNRISGKNYSTTPTGWGYVDDFRDINEQHIQSFLDQFPGNLKDRKLFGSSANVVSGAKVVNQPNIPVQIKQNDTMKFSVTTDKAADSVKMIFTNPPAEVTLSGAGTQWTFDHAITVAGDRGWVISVLQGGQVSDNHLKGVLKVSGSSTGLGGTSSPLVSLPLSPMPSVSQSFGNRLSYKTSACNFHGYHTGVDYAPVAVGQEVFAIADGKVVKTGQIGAIPNSLGSYVIVEHPQLGIRSYYLHVTPTVNLGAEVKANQKLAAIAATTAVGKHLHLEIQKSDFNVLDSNGHPKLFVGHSTTPVGSCGYLSRESDLAKGWLNPTAYLKQPTVQAGSSPHLANHEDIDAEDFPALTDQQKRSAVVSLFLSELAKKNQTFSGTLDEQARSAGLITSTSLVRPSDMASRMEVALLAYRLLQKFAPSSLPAAPGNLFPLDEFSETSDVAAQEYQRVVNVLAGVGVVNGVRDQNGELRFFPTRKATVAEVQAFVERTVAKIGTVAGTTPKIVTLPSIPSSIEQNGQLKFSVTTDRPVEKVVMVFNNPDAEAQLLGSGTSFLFDKSISVAGQRSWKLQLWSGGKAIDMFAGVLLVKAATGGLPKIAGNIETPAQVSINAPMKLRVQTTAPAAKVEIDFGNNTVFPLTSDGAKTAWTWEKELTQAGKRDYSIKVYSANAAQPVDQRAGSVQVNAGNTGAVVHPLPNHPLARILADTGYGYVFNSEHTGIDLMASVGTEVKSMCEGTVAGNYTAKDVVNAFLIIRHNCTGKALFGYYGHISSSLGNGATVKPGQVIGTVRPYGSNNHHLHFGINSNLLSRGWGRAPRGTTRQAMLSAGWIDPLEYLQHQGGTTSSRIDPFQIPVGERVSREQFGVGILDAIPAIGQKYQGAPEQRLRSAGVIQADYRGGDPVTRGDAVRMAFRLIEHNSGLAKLLAGKAQNRFDMDADLDDDLQLRQQANALAALGIVNGYQNGSLFELEPGQQLSRGEQNTIIERLRNLLMVTTAGAKLVGHPAIPASIDQNAMLTFSANTDRVADKVVMLFMNPDAEIELAGSGTTFTFSKPISVTGSRQWKLRVYSGGRITDESMTGTLLVKTAASIPRISSLNAQLQVQQNQNFALSVQTSQPVQRVVIEFQNPPASLNLSGSATNWSLNYPMQSLGNRQFTVKAISAGQVVDSKAGSVNVVTQSNNPRGSITVPIAPIVSPQIQQGQSPGRVP